MWVHPVILSACVFVCVDGDNCIQQSCVLLGVGLLSMSHILRSVKAEI